MQGARDAPPDGRQGVARLGAVTVNQLAEHQKREGVGKLKGGRDVAVCLRIDLEFAHQDGAEDAEHNAVQVVDRGGGEKKGENRPADSGH
jgi:hypothetical protein